MNILFLLKTLDLGGVEIVTSVLSQRFQDLGHKVFIFAFEKGQGTALERLDGLNVNVGCGFTLCKQNVLQLRKLLIKWDIGIIINQWGLPYIPIKTANSACKDLNVKIISVHHNTPNTNGLLKQTELAIEKSSNGVERSILKIKFAILKYITSRSMRYVYNHSDRYMVLSPSFIELFKQFTGIKNPTKLLVQTNPITIDASDFKFDFNRKQKEIVYVGRIDYNQKRVYRVIDTWALLEDKFPDWKLTIVGDGVERKNVERQAADLNLHRITFEGFQLPKSYYERASMLLLTSEYEGFPLVLAECMSLGVIPAVYGSYSAVYDIIEDGKDGVILPYSEQGYNAEKMADSISIVMNDNALRSQMAENAIIKSKKFSIDEIGKQWNNVFNESIL